MALLKLNQSFKICEMYFPSNFMLYLSPFLTTRLASPSARASLALTGLPVKMMSKARLRPINAGKRTLLKIQICISLPLFRRA